MKKDVRAGSRKSGTKISLFDEEWSASAMCEGNVTDPRLQQAVEEQRMTKYDHLFADQSSNEESLHPGEEKKNLMALVDCVEE